MSRDQDHQMAGRRAGSADGRSPVKLPDLRGQPQLRDSAAPPGLDCPCFLQMMAKMEGSGSGRRSSVLAELGQAGPPRGAGVSGGGTAGEGVNALRAWAAVAGQHLV